jgi:beta-aspartyl-peptidase (threonine type)
MSDEKRHHNHRTGLIKILAILALSLCLPAMAQEQSGRQFGSLSADSTVSTTDAQQIHAVLLKMLDRWNAHDIEGYLEVYWKSPELLVIVDSEQFSGWQQLHDSYVNGYPDRNSMGFIQPRRIQVKILRPNLALALVWWSISFPNSKQKVVGNTTMNLQKFDDGWKVVAAHFSTLER